MKEVFVLVVGFSAAMKLWLAVYDIHNYFTHRDRAHVPQGFRGGGRACVAITYGLLGFALAQADTIEVTWLGMAYLAAALGLLVFTVGELNTYDWDEDAPTP